MHWKNTEPIKMESSMRQKLMSLKNGCWRMKTKHWLKGLLEYPEEQRASDIEDLKQWVGAQSEPTNKKTKYYWVAAAAAIALLAVWSMGLLQGKNQQLYHKLYAHYEVSEGIVRGAGNRAQEKAISLYREDNCKELTAFMKTAEGEEAVSGNLLLGICMMEDGNHEEALMAFAKVSGQLPESVLEAAQWYSALCYLHLDNDKKARETAEALIEGKGFYASDAQNLLTGLN